MWQGIKFHLCQNKKVLRTAEQWRAASNSTQQPGDRRKQFRPGQQRQPVQNALQAARQGGSTFQNQDRARHLQPTSQLQQPPPTNRGRLPQSRRPLAARETQPLHKGGGWGSGSALREEGFARGWGFNSPSNAYSPQTHQQLTGGRGERGEFAPRDGTGDARGPESWLHNESRQLRNPSRHRWATRDLQEPSEWEVRAPSGPYSDQSDEPNSRNWPEESGGYPAGNDASFEDPESACFSEYPLEFTSHLEACGPSRPAQGSSGTTWSRRDHLEPRGWGLQDARAGSTADFESRSADLFAQAPGAFHRGGLAPSPHLRRRAGNPMPPEVPPPQYPPAKRPRPASPRLQRPHAGDDGPWGGELSLAGSGSFSPAAERAPAHQRVAEAWRGGGYRCTSLRSPYEGQDRPARWGDQQSEDQQANFRTANGQWGSRERGFASADLGDFDLELDVEEEGDPLMLESSSP